MSQPTRTMFILSNMRCYGGAERSIATLIPHLAQRLRLVVFAENPRHVAELEAIKAPNLEVLRCAFGNSPVALLRTMLLIARRVLRDQPELILCNGHKGALLLSLLRLVPFLIRSRVAVYIRDFGYRSLALFLKRFKPCLCLAPSAAVFEYEPYRAAGLVPGEHRLVVLNNATDVPADDFPAPEAGFVACCARLVPWKGVDHLIQAWPEVLKKQPGAQLRIYGDSVDVEYAAGLKEQAKALGLDASVQFHAFAKNMSDVFREGACFVIPSRSMLPGPETFSRIIIEAWAHHRPVIAYDTGGPHFLIHHEEDGLLVKEDDVAGLAASIVRVLGDDRLRREMGDRGFARVLAEFTPEQISDRLLAELFPQQAEPVLT